jgi:predicted DNA binding CopG/RHH family protein
MKRNRKKIYSSAPAGIAKELKDSVEVADFLPAPDHIASMIQKAEVVPITMNIKKKTLEKYKNFAQKKGIKYQVFVSTLLDTYAQRFYTRL